MDIQEFFQKYQPKMRAVFVTTSDITVESYVWIVGNIPYTEPVVVTIPAGTKLYVHPYSNFGDGYSMMPVEPKTVFKGKEYTNPKYRWFNCPYKDMEHLIDEKIKP